MLTWNRITFFSLYNGVMQAADDQRLESDNQSAKGGKSLCAQAPHQTREFLLQNELPWFIFST